MSERRLALTPALSPEERENRLGFFVYPTRPSFTLRWVIVIAFQVNYSIRSRWV